jgi:hypothetical protein
MVKPSGSLYKSFRSERRVLGNVFKHDMFVFYLSPAPSLLQVHQSTSISARGFDHCP